MGYNIVIAPKILTFDRLRSVELSSSLLMPSPWLQIPRTAHQRAFCDASRGRVSGSPGTPSGHAGRRLTSAIRSRVRVAAMCGRECGSSRGPGTSSVILRARNDRRHRICPSLRIICDEKGALETVRKWWRPVVLMEWLMYQQNHLFRLIFSEYQFYITVCGRVS